MAAAEKKTKRLGAYLAFLDESGFLLIPTVRRSWAPRGRTPLLHHSYRRDRISTISALTVSPRRGRTGLYVQFHRDNITGVEVVQFLRHLMRHVRGRIVLVWDGGTIHRRRLVSDYIAEHRVRLEAHRFPAYAPELNPDEFVWTQTKQRMANSAPQSIDELQRILRHSIQCLQRSQRLQKACLRMSTLFF